MSGCLKVVSQLIAVCSFLVSCAEDKVDKSRPMEAARPGLQERLSESAGYKQNEKGEWVPKSDKRSSYDSQRDTPYFKDKINIAKRFKTGNYEKKSWWGSKEYGKKSYQTDSDVPSFRTTARQDGQVSSYNDIAAKTSEPYKTNTLPRESARESRNPSIDKPTNAYIESQRKTYKAPSVIDWREQRSLDIDQSRGILGR